MKRKNACGSNDHCNDVTCSEIKEFDLKMFGTRANRIYPTTFQKKWNHSPKCFTLAMKAVLQIKDADGIMYNSFTYGTE